MGSRLSTKGIFKHFRLAVGYSLHEMAAPGKWKGKTLRELNLRSDYDVTVVASHDLLADVMVLPPDPDSVLSDSTALLLAGKDEDLDKISQLK